jgi:ribosomal protein S18 acetylase RimI-like enzyme
MHLIQIREATPADVPALAGLLAELARGVEGFQELDIAMLQRNCRRMMAEARSFFLLAIEGDAAVGCLSLSLRTTALHPGPSALIDELVVFSRARRRGIARQLIAAAIEKSRAAGCHEVEVSTLTTNTQARRFYKKCGFEENAVLLELEL